MPGLAMYNASKYAVVGLTAATRREYAATGVSVIALASGLDMKPIPKVPPATVAGAVVGSVTSREAEIAVPGCVGALAAAAAVTPERCSPRSGGRPVTTARCAPAPPTAPPTGPGCGLSD